MTKFAHKLEKFWPYKMRAIKNTAPRGKVLSRLIRLDLVKRNEGKTGKEVKPFLGSKPLKYCKVIKC